MGRNKPDDNKGAGLTGILGGLGNLLEKLTELAEAGEELRGGGEIGEAGKKLRGVYGFTVRTGLGREEGEIKVEPFGNVRPDRRTSDGVVYEVREPAIDVFDESDHVLVVAELPGVGQEDVHLELKDDILIVAASKGNNKYHKEVQLPCSMSAKNMTHACRNGVLEVKIGK